MQCALSTYNIRGYKGASLSIFPPYFPPIGFFYMHVYFYISFNPDTASFYTEFYPFLYTPIDYSNSFGILMHCLDDPVEKLLVFRLAGEGSCGPEAKAEVVHQLARLLADSILTTNTVRRYITIRYRIHILYY